MASENEAFDPFGHVADSDSIHFFETAHHDSLWHGFDIPGPMTKYMVMELVAAGLIVWGFLWVAQRIATGRPPKGKLWNFLEMILLFIRDEVARPAIGEHDYKRFLPFLWTLFLFILVLNLLGMVPFMASATASLAVTGTLALIAFCVIHYNGYVANQGFKGYMKSFVPHIEMDGPVMKFMAAFVLAPMLFFLEVMGAFIRGIVLAIRLFANMLAGHTVLVIILSFIQFAYVAGASLAMQGGITVASVGLALALSFLELFVACLQAFVFTFLTAIFIGLAMHPQH